MPPIPGASPKEKEGPAPQLHSSRPLIRVKRSEALYSSILAKISESLKRKNSYTKNQSATKAAEKKREKIKDAHPLQP